MASEITPKYYNKQTNIPVVGRFTKAATADWIVLPYPGCTSMRMTLYTGADDATLTYGTATVNNKGTAYTATDTAIVVDAGTITRQCPYYVQAGATGGEIMMVTSETAVGSSASTLTVIRGCLGTTAAVASVVDDVVLYIKNIVVSGAATTGVVDFDFIPMPWEPKGIEYT
jgi:hypothetical protein